VSSKKGLSIAPCFIGFFLFHMQGISKAEPITAVEYADIRGLLVTTGHRFAVRLCRTWHRNPASAEENCIPELHARDYCAVKNIVLRKTWNSGW
jgi:hypothetical protein